ncbi:MAG: CAP domain-containing protein [Candidatus Pseudobacter hemicellulosilyticus]|uniref:CAP domain-containing protein n=1 Tax=Candidatus Pseudobacter hemicellulosilyticus TaxID=3121375 RepID=A0AAJ6BF71_9BACT|nr:MAG: CAP domain-containing protein [Pseudobacter sp.]
MRNYRIFVTASPFFATILAFLVLLAACAPKPTASPEKAAAPAPRPTTTASLATGLEDDILALVNQYRKSKGLSPLTNNFTLTEEARKHTMAMATNRVPFGHANFNIRSKVITSKVDGTSAVAENVAVGSQTAKEVVDGWIKSAPHRKNMEGNYRLSGIGVARSQNAKLYFTQLFAR